MRSRPDGPALAGTAWAPSFAELDAAANGLAHAILERRGGRPERVALLLSHDAPLIAAALAVLKAGGTASVLSTRDPAARLGQARLQLEPDLVLVDAAHRGLALEAGFDAAQVADVPERPEPVAGPPPEVDIAPGDVAFIIFTSGSTGRPRGVIQTHRNVIHNALLRLANGLGLRAEDRIVLAASPSGGQGLATVWSTLLNGSTLCPFPVVERGVTGLGRWLDDTEVSVVTTSASIFRHFARTLGGDRLETVRLLRLGSEPALRADFDAFRRHFTPACEFANSFSASETGNITQLRLAPGAEPDVDGLPLGRAVAGVETLLLDERGDPVAPGEQGEIVVHGRYLSPGYWRDDALTAERFGSAPDGGDRRFRTGDLGWLDDDGLLRWSARRDARVKIRGNSVDLSEVEGALLGRPEVAAAAVCARTSNRGGLSLTGYVTPLHAGPLDTERLRAGLRETLPEHALPSTLVPVDALPLTSHGKLDRAALAQIQVPEPRPGAAPGTVNETEELLVGIWARALDREVVGRDESFFELGGDSLVAAVIAAGVHTAFGVELDLGSFVEHPTVSTQATLIDGARVAVPDLPPMARVSRAGPLPLTFAQERTWETATDPVKGPGYSMARSQEFRGHLDVSALRRSVERMFRRHEILRASFTELADGRPVHVIHPPGPVELPLVDLSGEADPAAAAAALLERDARKAFDPREPPLLRLVLVRLADDRHHLMRLNHHIISDGRSWEIFFAELAQLYAAEVNGDPPPLSEEPELQYVDYAAWERESGAALARREEDQAWWRQELLGNPGTIPLPCARRRPRAGAEPSDGAIWWGLPPAHSAALDRLAREAGATFLMSRLALFTAQLALDTGQYDVVLGTYVSGRRRPETHSLFGFFSNFATLRLPFDRDLSFAAWLDRVRDKVVAVSAHCDTPYELVREGLAADGFELPEVGTIFAVSAYQTRPFADLELTALRRETQIMPWGFTWAVDRGREPDHCLITMDPRTHHPRAARALVGRVRRLAADVCAAPELPLGSHQPRRERVAAAVRRRAQRR